jgi:hypothetical protein
MVIVEHEIDMTVIPYFIYSLFNDAFSVTQSM